MRIFRVVLLLVVSFNLPMLAQTRNGEIFGGYSLEHIAPGCGADYTCGTSNDVGRVTKLEWVGCFGDRLFL
jgi:hypothetical protein